MAFTLWEMVNPVLSYYMEAMFFYEYHIFCGDYVASNP